MFSVTAKQHSKILGWAIVAYGIHVILNNFFYNLSDLREIVNSYFKFGSDVFFEGNTLRDALTNLLYFLVFSVAGFSILRFNNNLKFISLSFVLAAFTFFPLGTILSFYTLFYLFVISKNETTERQTAG